MTTDEIRLAQQLRASLERSRLNESAKIPAQITPKKKAARWRQIDLF